MIRIILSIISLFFIFLIHGQADYTPKNSIERKAYQMMQEGVLKNASFTFQVYDLTNDSVLASYNEHKSLTPASTMKLFSTATAICTFGSYKQFETKLTYTGNIDSNGVLQGDLYIIGGGDPSLGSKYFTPQDSAQDSFMNEWVSAIQKEGIKSINGRVIGDASAFSEHMIPGTWSWGDIGNYYGAGPNGLTIYDNLLSLSFNSGKNDGDSTVVDCYEPFLPNITFNNQVRASKINRDRAYIFAAPYQPQKTITGFIPRDREDFIVKGTIYDPAYQAAYDLEYHLLKNGISVSQNASTSRLLRTEKPTTTTFYTHKSPTLSRIAYWTNHLSVNLFAEHLFQLVGLKRVRDGSNYGGSVALSNFWKKHMNTSGLYISDGSGLSRQNAVSASHFIGLLKYMKKSKYYNSFYTSLPIAGRSGTLSSIGRGTAAANNVRAKSGTMTRVKSYAGYAKTKSGKEVAFAMVINNYNCYTSTVTKKLEKLMVAIANYNG